MHDIARVSWRRHPGMPLYLFPVKVQGDGAAREIAEGLRVLDTLPQVDVIIVGRGGGSMEDLWAFNEERVARAISACHTPVISAVGHETDFTIADFVADVRAPTPSAAAEMAVPEREELADGLLLAIQQLDRSMLQCIGQRRLQLSMLQKRLLTVSPAQRRERLLGEIAQLQMRMDSAARSVLGSARVSLDHISPLLDTHMRAAFLERRNRLECAKLRLNASGPLEMLNRGYAIVTDGHGLVRSAAALRPGDRVSLKLADGTAAATIDAVNTQT